VHDFVHLRRSFLSSCAIISPIVSSTSDLMTLVSASACLDQGVDGILDFRRRALGTRLEGLFSGARQTRPRPGFAFARLAELFRLP